MSAHTSTPWRVTLFQDGAFCIATEETHPITIAERNGWPAMATEMHANAKLIGVAPELRHFALWVENMCHDPGLSEAQLRRYLSERAAELVRKADGK